MTNFRQKHLILPAAVSVGVLLLSNLAALQSGHFLDMQLNGGVSFFPFAYLAGSYLAKANDSRMVKSVYLIAFTAQLAVIVSAWLLKIEEHRLWLMGTPLCAYLAANFLNDRFVRRQKPLLLSFALSQLLAVAVFGVIGISVLFSPKEVLFTVFINYGAGILLSLLCIWIVFMIGKSVQRNRDTYQNDNRFYFEITQKIPGKLGRAGIIHTPHGDIQTPAFMSVGTKGEVRFLSMEELKSVGAQAMLSNGYHLRNRSVEIAKQGGLAKWSGWDGPTLTDSGGFQVMSLGSGLGKVVSMEREKEVVNTDPKDRLTTVSEDGVQFVDPFTNQLDFIGPEESMQIQCRIGADIHMAYDELTSLADSYEYNVEALARTERWAVRSLNEHEKHCDDLGYHQALYGVIQGGRWEDLRRSTAKKFAKMNFDGYGLGGAFLKENLGDILRWCNEELPEQKPRHLLGLSRPDDILIGTEMGADTFDCVAPTREARHGRIYTKYGNINIKKFADSDELLDEHCDCPTCKAGYTRSQLRALLKSENPEERSLYFKLASMHNLRFIIRLTEEAREAIIQGSFAEYKERFLRDYYGHR